MKKEKILLVVSFILISTPFIKAQLFYSSNPLAHTYSIIAVDSAAGEMGGAVQSHWFSVGSVVIWGEAGVGMIATQSFVNPSFGPNGLALLKKGLTPQQAVDSLIGSDEGRDLRQLAIINTKGDAAAYTGKNCIQGAGHIVGNNFSAQGNLMLNDKVWAAMASTFEETKGKLAERLIAALEAAQNVGGDIRGQQSASLLVVKLNSTGKVWEDRLIDLRVEDNPNPVKELKRLLNVHRAYEHMNNGDLAVEKGNMELAMQEYSSAEKMFPKNEEMKYWHAVTLVNNNQLDNALPLFEEVFKMNENWKTLTPRLVKSGLLNVDEKDLNKILEVK